MTAAAAGVGPEIRRRTLVDRPPDPRADFVLYWMTGARRLGWNYALDRAVELAVEHRKPLVVLEALRIGYRWANRRHHAFLLQGMAENLRRARGLPLLYHPYVEPEADAGRGLLAALSRRAVAIVADEVPCFFYPRMLAAATRQVGCRLEAVDGNGLLPLRAGGKLHATAHAFRRHLHRNLRQHLSHPPLAAPLAGRALPRRQGLPEEIRARWPAASAALLGAEPSALGTLSLDDAVPPVSATPGGSAAAETRLAEFLDRRLAGYADARRHPDLDAASGLSPYLHHGHISVHQVLSCLAEREGWQPETLPGTGDGAREGWWGMSRSAEAFLDQLVTWRELGLNFCVERPADYDRYESLPGWALASLEKHAADPRPAHYEPAEMESSATTDELWNAAQRELVDTGVVHNQLRMLWGKRVLEWTEHPRAALERLVEMNNRWALDGRDANSYSGIFWCFGRYDRPWGPERPIFGVVRYLSSTNTRRKLRLRAYLERYGRTSSTD